ncbi:hypothetical protein D3C86_2120320 [compost metagenome]
MVPPEVTAFPVPGNPLPESPLSPFGPTNNIPLEGQLPETFGPNKVVFVKLR